MTPPREMTVYREDDGDVAVLSGKTVAVVGYGSLGRPLALNLREATGARIIAGGRPDADLERAVDDGLPAFSIAEATAQADVVLFLVPDEVQPAVFKEHVRANLRDGAAVVFASGYNLAFEPIALPPTVDVLLFAPRMLGRGIRQFFLEGKGYFSYVSVEQDATGGAMPLLLALAKGAGSLRRGALGITAAEEAQLDLFGEQALGPWLGAAILTAFHVGTEAGLPPEGLLLEMYLSGEMAQTFQAMADEGFLRSVEMHGYTAAFGGMLRNMTIDHDQIAESMTAALEGIRSGEFAQKLQEEVAAGYPSRPYLDAMLAPENTINRVEDGLRRKLGGEVGGEKDVHPAEA